MRRSTARFDAAAPARRLLVVVDGTAVTPPQLDALRPAMRRFGRLAQALVVAPRGECLPAWRQQAALAAYAAPGVAAEVCLVDHVPFWFRMRAEVDWWLWPRDGGAGLSASVPDPPPTPRSHGVAFVVAERHLAQFGSELERWHTAAATFLYCPTKLRQRSLASDAPGTPGT